MPYFYLLSPFRKCRERDFLPIFISPPVSRSIVLSLFLCGSSAIFADAVLIVSDKNKQVPVSRPFDANTGDSNNRQRAAEQWTLINQVEQLQQEIQQLRGTTEEQAYLLKQFKKSSRDRYLDLDRRISQLVSSKAVPVAAKMPSKNLTPLKKASAEEEALYGKAKKKIKVKRFDDAISLLNQLLTDFPEGAYASNAYYWLGEVNLALPVPDYQSAEIYFLKLLQRDARHRKVPAALFKLGKLYDMTGQAKLADKYLSRVIQQHSKSSAATLARKYLQSMGAR
ncbi:MAG: tetratricopeptide repeat protein [Gammaproteobacteria bacterium]|nr:tetratricopeptide repeat protein [Gammaproteobacteria bacterium]